MITFRKIFRTKKYMFVIILVKPGWVWYYSRNWRGGTILTAADTPHNLPDAERRILMIKREEIF